MGNYMNPFFRDPEWHPLSARPSVDVAASATRHASVCSPESPMQTIGHDQQLKYSIPKMRLRKACHCGDILRKNDENTTFSFRTAWKRWSFLKLLRSFRDSWHFRKNKGSPAPKNKSITYEVDMMAWSPRSRYWKGAVPIVWVSRLHG